MFQTNRRALLIGAGALAAAAGASGRAFAQADPPPSGPYKLDPLPYPTKALEPNIDAMTMEIHHDKHHKAYVDNLNKALKDHAELAKLSLEELLTKLDEIPDAIRTAVRNNGGGHANHTMFWQVIGPDGGAPAGALAKAIDSDLGGLDKLKEDFNTAGTKVFGSGWVFITVDKAGKLALVPKPNQDTPLMEGKRVLFGNDVWEHAYYLKYQNKRADYLKAWWNTVNWEAVGKRYQAALDGKLTI